MSAAGCKGPYAPPVRLYEVRGYRPGVPVWVARTVVATWTERDRAVKALRTEGLRVVVRVRTESAHRRMRAS